MPRRRRAARPLLHEEAAARARAVAERTARRGLFECWPWTGAASADGRPVITVPSSGARRQVPVARVVLCLRLGRDLPADRLAVRLPSCTPTCVNPAHLTEVRRGAFAPALGRPGRRLSRKEREEVGRLCAEGAPPSEVAALFGISRQAVSWNLGRLREEEGRAGAAGGPPP